MFDPVGQNPFYIFHKWMEEAKEQEPNNPNAMCLSTVNANGYPSSRMVLLKDYDETGFVFYTNSDSRKGGDLAGNPHVALCLYWKSSQRQVRIEGKVNTVPRDMTTAYFHSRPRGSQIASAASLQSRPLPDKQIYLDRIKELENRYEGETCIPCPDHWNGYRVIPSMIELWQEGEFRTHDRFAFTMNDRGEWVGQRLYP